MLKKQNAITCTDSSCLQRSTLNWSSSTANRRTAEQYYARGNSRTDRQTHIGKRRIADAFTQTKNIHNKRRKFVSTKEGLSRETKLLAIKLAANLDINCWWPQCEIAAQNAVTYFWVGSWNLRQWRTIYLTLSIILFWIYNIFDCKFRTQYNLSSCWFDLSSQLYFVLRTLVLFKVIWLFWDFISRYYYKF